MGDFTLNQHENVWCALDSEITTNIISLMKKYKDDIDEKAVLDIGTGTGILSLYAYLLGANYILATDIDERAVRCANENFLHNNIENAKAVLNNLSEGINRTFDIIIANLPIDTQIHNLKTISQNMTDTSLLFISWYNESCAVFSLEDYSSDYDMVDCLIGHDFDGYVMKRRK